MPTHPGPLMSRFLAWTRSFRRAGGRPVALAGIIVLCLPALILGALLTGMLLAGPRPASTGPNPGITEPATGSPVPSAEVDRVHDALHELASQCQAGIDETTRQKLDQDVEMMVEFSRRYPDARFPIDDETGGPVGLLLVARNALERCAPESAAKADSALPPEFRRPAASPPS
ncbi:hypothetical protein PV772_14930 [Pseudarthrobacter sp. CC12]|uniref:hypothetical protein n=1 Tax=unclassified Pseudarthrobacter TaxID=2647000 RepID=UPI0010578498|nr:MULTISPECIES: hypothetical protein [unclassified Pseudarthrobacter]QDG63815.1 hypothetical protein NIBR502771_16835 [Pseudarthrobacter sp. NIBRBAC000502771]